MGDTMNQTCETCIHYRQYYIRMGYRYNAIHSGHCVYPKGKLRYAETRACRNYKEKENKKAD